MRRDLLGPLIWRIHGVCPAHGIVVVGFRAPQFVDAFHQEFGSLQSGGAVEVDHFVVGAVQGALRGRAVIPDDVINQRVVENAEPLNGIHQTAEMVIGVLHEPGVHLHLPDEHGLQFGRHFIPRWDFLVPCREFGIGRNDP